MQSEPLVQTDDDAEVMRQVVTYLSGVRIGKNIDLALSAGRLERHFTAEVAAHHSRKKGQPQQQPA